MTSRCRLAPSARLMLALALAVVTLAGCEREERESRSAPVAESAPAAIALSSLFAGETRPAPTPPPQRAEYENNAYHVSEGKRLFEWFNCSGCHSHGGGGMGPPLMDDRWIYGSQLENIYATIVQGRPNGMPSFQNKIPEQQVWQLAAYVRSMSGQLRKDVAPGRSDSLSAGPSEQRTPQATPRASAVPEGR
jgi:cytochrome c oxidase cbb3-type subunit III